MSELQSSLQLPVLDLTQPIESSVLSSLSQACKEWGFFYVTNHGISKEMFNKTCTLSRDVFKVPLESKLKLGPFPYTPRYIASPYFESLVVSGPDFSTSAKASEDVLFQDHHKPELRETLQEYGTKMDYLSKRLIKILLMMTLGDETGKRLYQTEFSNCHGYLRLVNYTPPPDVEKREELVEGLGMHTDMSCITIVYQDSVGGLQMRSKEEKWIDINPCEDLLVVNIGDLMQAWSNGRLRSSEHRVVLRKLVNRVSLAFFICFEDEKVILAPQEIVGEGNCRSYKSFKCSEYLKFRQSNEVGKFEKIGYTVKDFAGLELAQPDDF
ncbi:PREDICTED: probable 2-oxoglutarate-dependent dioxygenase AOP1 [Camelina sativa]|uniref:Probable 2-oxoglutarate-dependent dioxygenase AOP1 n=1 Tax=Camelina sativa TaxID=90675 RepID=A0ABM0UZV7_CAMSA|nr:PREDICTED: probable 2-oxoglutarate-dependent dioxygenase AOP1 [Camelina sativa]